jgi:hypothetical protein
MNKKALIFIILSLLTKVSKKPHFRHYEYSFRTKTKSKMTFIQDITKGTHTVEANQQRSSLRGTNKNRFT